MTRYFFDVLSDGQLDHRDKVGVLLPDRAAAQREASLCLADLARDEFWSARPSLRVAISVRTVEGPVCEAAYQWNSLSLH